MRKIHLLWTDDEIDLLRPHILFLEEKGYLVDTANNGDDAIELVKKINYDLILLDENMPGRSGLMVLNEINRIAPGIPVIMITKSEEENIMEEAIGAKISDYLIKPVKPNQILLSIKKNIDHKRLITEKTTSAYQSEFRNLGILINGASTFNDWKEIYYKLVYWELELDQSKDHGLDEVLKLQKIEANSAFAKFIKSHYLGWFDKNAANRPLLSPSVFKNKVFPLLSSGTKVYVFLLDNLRLDHWKMIQPILQENFHIEEEDLFCSILPTSTQYARNSMFAGLMPSEIEKLHPEIWLNDEEEGGKNQFEEALLKRQLARSGFSDHFYYAKILNNREGKKVLENMPVLLTNQFGVLVYNFVDILSHARTEMDMIRELANDESAYRSLMLSWFEHSPLLEMLTALSEKDVKIILTTDHGSIRVNNPVKVVGDKNTTTNLRYKQGRNLNYNPREVFEINDPLKAYLPKTNVSSSYIFTSNDDFFAYPNNYNHYVKYYRNTFQHGGISMEEMLIPMVVLSPKK